VLSNALCRGADEADIFIALDKSLNLSIEKNQIKSANSREECGIGIRIIKNKKIGFAYTTKIRDKKEIKKIVDKAISISRLSEESKNFHLPSYKPSLKAIPKTFDSKITEMHPKEYLEFLSQVIDAASCVDKDIIVSGGGLNVGENITILANSNNVYIADKSTFLSIGATVLIKKCNITSGFEIMESRTLEDIDPYTVGKNAAELAKNMQKPRRAENGRVDAIFMPYAFVSLIEGTFIPALYADKSFENATMFSNKLNKVVIDENLTIYDDPLMEGGLNSSATDDELVPSKKTMLIEDGILKSYLYDQKTACKYSKESTSNGVRVGSFKSLPSISARNIIIDAKDKCSKEEMIENTKDGILVYDILGAHTSDPASGNFSVASSILFKIKNGKIVYPIKKAMISGNILDSLNKDVEVCNEYKMLSGSMSAIAAYLPAIKVKDIKIIK